ncbi:MAG: YggS family pyridoxal phosphate enzyme, partial [Clostridia bacterium]|nr:YggS family pyridoxal phosphate enzyme [Clostridia bacterium]
MRDTLARESAPWGRMPTLIAVTKYSTPAEILPLADLGVTHIGENRVQSLREKLPFLEEKFSIHLIGRLQTNKVKYIIKDVCMIHSLDSMPLAQEIDRQAQKAGRRMP